MKPKILMLVNEFPPTGESGVQRPLKFLKYLDRSGWQAYVITPRKPTKTVQDPSLCRDIPEGAKVYKTFSLGFGGKTVAQVARLRRAGKMKSISLRSILSKIAQSINHHVFPLDKQVGWVPFAYLTACKIIKMHGIKNVYITAYPFSAFLAGLLLKRKFGNRITWVADYRDAWQFEPLMAETLPKARMKLIRRMDERVLRSCDKAVFSTEATLNTYIEHYPWLAGKAAAITNGYDEDDFQGLEPIRLEPFTVLYMGKVYNLSRPDVLPVLEALRRTGWEDLNYIHIGSLAEEAAEAIRSCGFGFYDYRGYKGHREALAHALAADINLLIINDDAYSGNVLPGKMFELMRAGRPILAVGPKDGIVRGVIESSGAGEYVHTGDPEGILEALGRLRERPQDYRPNPEVVKMYNRAGLCRQLVGLYG